MRYMPRSREEGKKIGPRDWFIARADVYAVPQRMTGGLKPCATSHLM